MIKAGAPTGNLAENQPHPTDPLSTQYAAIDLGSHSFHLLVARQMSV